MPEVEILSDDHTPQVAVNTTAGLSTNITVDLAIDITQQRCPMTFVRTRLALDRLVAGQVLAVRLLGDEPRRNVPRTAAEQGHAVLRLHEEADGSATLFIRKGMPAG